MAIKLKIFPAMEETIYNIIIILLFILSVPTFISLLFISAPYGRYAREGWGIEMEARTGWIIQELPSVVVFAVVFIIGELRFETLPWVFFIMWQVHYVHRTLIYPLRISNRKNTNLTTVILAMIFTTLNSYINARWLTHFSAGYDITWLYDPRFIIGTVLFVAGFIANRHSDHILRKLRKPGEQDYKIPHGGLFKYVSAPNYLGEIVEWFGWAIATWSLPGLCFAVFTLANLAPRAYSHHKWYLKNFPDYPKDRKALLPFII